MTEQELLAHADAWIRYWHAPEGSTERDESDWATDLYDLTYDDSETLWKLILAIHSKDQSPTIQQVLSAGPVEDLLDKHGADFISRIEIEARRDPAFAKLLGGVWKSGMSEDIWLRLQAVWDRRGWDGIPE
jgi:hypothetical protein